MQYFERDSRRTATTVRLRIWHFFSSGWRLSFSQNHVSINHISAKRNTLVDCACCHEWILWNMKREESRESYTVDRLPPAIFVFFTHAMLLSHEKKIEFFNWKSRQSRFGIWKLTWSAFWSVNSFLIWRWSVQNDSLLTAVIDVFLYAMNIPYVSNYKPKIASWLIQLSTWSLTGHRK